MSEKEAKWILYRSIATVFLGLTLVWYMDKFGHLPFARTLGGFTGLAYLFFFLLVIW